MGSSIDLSEVNVTRYQTTPLALQPLQPSKMRGPDCLPMRLETLGGDLENSSIHFSR